MARVRLSVDLAPELRRRVRIAAASHDMSVRQWIEQAIEEPLERAERCGWMESDLSRLGEFEPYEWEEGELDECDPARYIPGKGYVAVIDTEKDGGEKSG